MYNTLFILDHYSELHAQCSLLTHDELDPVLMGFLSSAMLDSDNVKDGRHQKPAKRRCLTISYMHHGVDVCKKTFLFLHSIEKDHSYRLLRTTIRWKDCKQGNIKTADVA